MGCCGCDITIRRLAAPESKRVFVARSLEASATSVGLATVQIASPKGNRDYLAH